jgi:hypothetical protein
MIQTDPGPPTLNLARTLLAYEADAGSPSEASMVSPLFRVSEKLRGHLVRLIGASAFQVLLSRALLLAKRQAAALDGLCVKRDGSLQALSEGSASAVDGAAPMLIAQLLSLLITFTGPALTMRMVRDVWPGLALEFDVKSDDPTREQ